MSTSVETRPGDFWSRSDAADRALTRLVAATDEPSWEAATDEMIVVYERAFASRSTWSERQTVIGHLRDLGDLIPDADPRRPHLQRALDDLQQWEEANVEHANASANDVPHVAEATTSTRVHTVASSVALTAFPAGCGDCLLIEWDGAAGHHRMLIDGGMASALDEGVGRYAAALPEARLVVDVEVVTHIDLDHIGGAIAATRAGLVEAHDVWFNGLDEIRSLTRGARQGDEFSSLIPAELRNRPVNGAAICIPDDGALPVFDLADGARCTVLGPTSKRLDRLEQAWMPARRGEADDPLADLLQRLGDDIDRGGARSFGADHSVPNGSSIALLFEYGGTSLLLTADAYAGDLQQSIRRLLDERKQDHLEVDLFKVAHHGSMNNVTSELLDLVEPGVVLICTDGSRFGHPDVEAIDLLRKHYPSTPIQFTDDTPIVRERAAHAGSVPPSQVPVSFRF